MFAPINIQSKDAKLKNAEKIKEEKRRWKEEKLLREREAAEAVRRKNQELTNLENAFIDELSRRKVKKEEEKVERFFYVKKKKTGATNFSARPTGNSKFLDPGVESESDSRSVTDKNNQLGNNSSRNASHERGKQLKQDENPWNLKEVTHFKESPSQGNYFSSPGDTQNRSNDLISKNPLNLYQNSKNSFSPNHKNLISLNQNSSNFSPNQNFKSLYRIDSSSPSNQNNFKSEENFATDEKSKNDAKFALLKPTGSHDMQGNDISEKTEGSLISATGSTMSERKKVKVKTQKKFLPLILRPVNNGMLTVHIVGESSPAKAHSENNTPIRMEDESKHLPYFHMFRDFEVINKSSNCLPASKVQVMRDYDKEVKRFHTPKRDINYNLRLENKKLEKYLENTVKRIKFFKIFK